MAIKYASCKETHDGFSWTLQPWQKKGMKYFNTIAEIPKDHCLVVAHFAPWWSPLKEWIADGRPWIEIEYGYWGPDNPKRETRRVTYCGHHNLNLRPRPYPRTVHFPEPKINPWQPLGGEYVLIPMPVEKILLQRTGENITQWCDRISAAIAPYWQGPIVWRKKIGNSGRFATFQQSLKHAYAVVGERSMSCTEAVLLGVPAFTIDTSMSTLLMGGIEHLANPGQPDRSDWWDHVCWSQFHPDEFAKGSIVADLVEQYQM